MVDTNKVIKCKFKSILLNTVNYTHFFEIITRSNKLYILCSHFIRSYLLFCFKNNLQIPKLDSDFIRIAFKTLSKDSRGPKTKGNNLIIYNDLRSFYQKFFVQLMPTVHNESKLSNEPDNINNSKMDSRNLSHVYTLFANEMEVSYMNNIQLNFFKYLHQFVNEFFLIQNTSKKSRDEYLQLSSDEKKIYNKEQKEFHKKNKIIKSELLSVKHDLIYGTNKSNEKYHKWISEQRSIILPNLNNFDNHEDQLKVNHHIYLKHMLVMNQLLEKNNKKMFQAICLKTSLTDKYVHFDSACIRDIFKGYKYELTDEQMWKTYFNVAPKIKGYSFNNLISTDGHSVSLNFIKDEQVEPKKKKLENQQSAIQQTKERRKGMTDDERRVDEQLQIQINIQKKHTEIKIQKEFQKKGKDEYNKLIKEDQEKRKLLMKLAKNKFEYIEDAIKNKEAYKDLLDKFNKGKIVVGDPGRRTLLTLLGKGNNNGKGKMRHGNILFSYNNRRRIKETKRIIYNKKLDNYKKKILIENDISLKERESQLSNHNSKTINFEKFNEYTKIKLQLREDVMNNSNYNDYVNQYRWYGYINKQRHEAQILNELAEIYGNDAIFVLGDWSDRGSPIKYISTPCIGLKKLLSKKFMVYLIDEYKTSKVYYKDEQAEGDHLKLSSDDRELYAVLTFTMGNNTVCINRDNNAVHGMRTIVESLMKYKKRPATYTRTKKSFSTEVEEVQISNKSKKRSLDKNRDNGQLIMSPMTGQLGSGATLAQLVQGSNTVENLNVFINDEDKKSSNKLSDELLKKAKIIVGKRPCKKEANKVIFDLNDDI